MKRKEKSNKDEKLKGKIGRKDTRKSHKKLYIRKKILHKNSLARSNPISMQGGD